MTLKFSYSIYSMFKPHPNHVQKQNVTFIKLYKERPKHTFL